MSEPITPASTETLCENLKQLRERCMCHVRTPEQIEQVCDRCLVFGVSERYLRHWQAEAERKDKALERALQAMELHNSCPDASLSSVTGYDECNYDFAEMRRIMKAALKPFAESRR